MEVVKAKDIKACLDMQKVAEFYGVKFDRRRGLCPFHNDTNPSMTIKNGNYRCWACGARGDVIDFVKAMFGLNTVQAMAKLNNDFMLGFSFEGDISTGLNRSQIHRADSIRKYKKGKEESRNNKILALNAYHRYLTKYPEYENIRKNVEDELDELLLSGGK